MARVSRVDSYENSSTVKYAQVKNGQVELRISRTFFHFSTKAALCMTNFVLRINRISAKSNAFLPFATRISRSQAAFQVYFIVECSQIPNLAAGQLQALQHKPSRQVAVVWYGLQIIAFVAYQLLTIPLRVDPLCPRPHSGFVSTISTLFCYVNIELILFFFFFFL